MARFVLALVLGAVCMTSDAAGLQFDGSITNGKDSLIYAFNRYSERILTYGRPIDMSITVDQSNLTVGIDEFSFVAAPKSINRTWKLTNPDGFGTTEFVVSVTFNIESGSATNWLPKDLIRLDSTSSRFTTDRWYADEIDAAPIEVTGNYSITGPTESESGSFSFFMELLDSERYPSNGLGDTPGTNATTISFSQYPDQVNWQTSGGIDRYFLSYGVRYGYEPVFDTNLDGFNLELLVVDYNVRMDYMNLANAQVPIPAAAWLFGSALVLLGWMKVRR